MPQVPSKKPKLVNRGPAGLLNKVHKGDSATNEHNRDTSNNSSTNRDTAEINRITPSLLALSVPTDVLHLDPNNARLHPDRNLDAICASLQKYGQTKPVVVRKENMTVVAGNGTLEAARILGWTNIAANVVEMSEAEATGYGLADNRSAELAKWDFEVVARLDKLLQQSKDEPIGWSKDELEVLRQAEWTPPPLATTTGTPSNDSNTGTTCAIEFTAEEMVTLVQPALDTWNEQNEGEVGTKDFILKLIQFWIEEV